MYVRLGWAFLLWEIIAIFNANALITNTDKAGGTRRPEQCIN